MAADALLHQYGTVGLGGRRAAGARVHILSTKWSRCRVVGQNFC